MHRLLLLLIPLVLAADKKPAPDPAAVRGRQLAEVAPRFDVYVFAGKKTGPHGLAYSVAGAAELKDELDRASRLKTIHDGRLQTVAAQDDEKAPPGPYACRMEIKFRSG